MSMRTSVQAMARRRFIAVSAAAAGLELLPIHGVARAEAHVARWRGLALGAAASMQIHHPDQEAAAALIARSVREVRRLERVFSLYRDDSALAELNRRGVSAPPPAELVELLRAARRYAGMTGGAFDPSVQPLWAAYADHFARPDADPAGPPRPAIEAALAKVGFADVLIGRDRVALPRRGMALTLNGIAQGYITDRVVALLRAAGLAHSLVDMGESRAIGARPDGRPWQVGIADPDRPETGGDTIAIVDQAVATSGGYGFRFDATGRFTHLLDPRTGLSPRRYRSVTVVMPTATEADALSTAFGFMPVERIAATLAAVGHGRALVVDGAGRRSLIGA